MAKKSKSKKQIRMSRLLAQAFPGLELVEAKERLVLFPKQTDFDNAVRNDPQHCGFANTAKRVCGASAAHFFARYVYLDHPDEDGKRKVFRYVTNKRVYDALADFDRGKKVDVKRAFVLGAPSESNTLKAHRKYNKAYLKSPTYKAIQAEKKAQAELQRSEREFEQARVIASKSDFRPGTANEIKRRVEAAKIQLAKARNTLTAASKRAKDLRYEKYGTGVAKPRKYDVQVRSGTGTWAKRASA